MEYNGVNLVGIAEDAFWKFSDVADYIWKLPEFIDAQRELEIGKLADYFPLTGHAHKDQDALLMRALRWTHESRKLDNVFPDLVAVGSLFIAASLFETFCLLLCKEIEQHTKKPLGPTRGSGVARLLRYISESGIKWNQCATAGPAQAALKIRNCLFHASGFLYWSRDEQELRKILARFEYLSADQKQRRQKLKDPSVIVEIVSGPTGDRLEISHTYAFISTGHFRDHFLDLWKAWHAILNRQ